MKLAIAKRAFKRSDTGAHVVRGQRIQGDDAYFDELQKLGLIMGAKAVPGAPEQKNNPPKAVGEATQSSASPAAPASRKKTAKKSAAGGKKEARDA